VTPLAISTHSAKSRNCSRFAPQYVTTTTIFPVFCLFLQRHSLTVFTFVDIAIVLFSYINDDQANCAIFWYVLATSAMLMTILGCIKVGINGGWSRW